MSETNPQRPKPPLFVRACLLGVPSRKMAMLYFRISIIGTIGMIVFAMWLPLFWIAAVGGIVSALAYWFSAKWADENSYWEQ